MVTRDSYATETLAKIETGKVAAPARADTATESLQRGLVKSSNITAGHSATAGQGALAAEYPILLEPSAATAQGPETRRTTETQISRVVTSEAKAYVAGKRHLVQGLEGIILEYANQSQVKVDEIKIEVKRLLQGKKRKPILWVTAKVGPQVHPNQALAVWDAIGAGIDGWRRRLPALDRRLLHEEISLSVDWVEPNASPTG